MKEAEEREGGRERGRGGDTDLLERSGRAFLGLCLCEEEEAVRTEAYCTATKIMKDIPKFMLNSKSLSK